MIRELSFDPQHTADAFMRTAQYLASLTSQQDVWDELGSVLISFFGADLVIWARATNLSGELEIRCRAASGNSCAVDEYSEAAAIAAEVIESGFLEVRTLHLPESYCAVFLPVPEGARTAGVIVIAHKSVNTLPRDTLNVYLAVVGLAGSTAMRLAQTRELDQHRHHLEQLVRARTAELEQANQFLNTVIESLTHPFCVVDARSSRVLMANAAARHDQSGDQSANPARCFQLAHNLNAPCSAHGHPCPLVEVKRSREPVVVEHVDYDADGEARTTEVHGYPILNREGEVVQMIEYSLDITERKRAENVLRTAKEAADNAARAKSEFLANMSHEIRTPMNAVIGMTSLLLDTELTPEQQDYVETVRSSGDALLTIINDILDFSKIEAGKLELEVQPFSLATSIEETLDLFSTKAAQKGIELVYWVDEDVPAALWGDATRLREILVNLVGNAIKFTEHGEIVVTATVDPQPVDALAVDPLPAGRSAATAGVDSFNLHVAVKDSGIGIPHNRMDRLFQAFTQVDASTTRRYGGTGLGLSISKRLAEIMGGRIWVESEVRQGSTFHFTVRTSSAPAGSEPSAISEGALVGHSLLIVDDNATNRRILLEQARRWGMQTHATPTGAETLAVLANSANRFDVAILDMDMPGMDGLQLGAAIQAIEPPIPLPLVMLTSVGSSEVRKTATALGFAACLSKPVKQKQLYEILVRTLHKDVMSEPAAGVSLFDETLGRRLPLRILLVEDNVVNQKVAQLMLSKLGYNADVAGNGLEALQALARQHYDVVFMDVQMPEMDGIEATRTLRRTLVAAEQPVVVAMTAGALLEDQQACLDAGMDNFIPKPVKVVHLRDALQKAAWKCGWPENPAVG